MTRDLANAKKEHLIGLYLDSQNGLIHRETISVGSLNTTRSHPREILYPAIAHLGEDTAGDWQELRKKPRTEFRPGKFVSPHGACFDHSGNIFVTEWVDVGRVTKLRRV